MDRATTRLSPTPPECTSLQIKQTDPLGIEVLILNQVTMSDRDQDKSDKKDMRSEYFHCHELDAQFLEAYQISEAAAEMPSNISRRTRFFHLIEMFKLSAGVPGATLEAGCFRGMASHLLCHYRRVEDPEFNGHGHIMVDSFEGLSPPIEADGAHAKKSFDNRAFTTTSVERVKQTLSEFPGVQFLQGWIPEILAELPDTGYRFVHIDVDIYEPTLDCLRYFYPRMNRGGIIVCDDFGPWPENIWEGCEKAFREFCNENQIPFAKLDSGNAVIIKR